MNDGAEDHFYIADDSAKLLVIEPITGNTQIAGSLDVGKTVEIRRDLLVGGTLEDHTITVQSLDGTADLYLESGGVLRHARTTERPRERNAHYYFSMCVCVTHTASTSAIHLSMCACLTVCLPIRCK